MAEKGVTVIREFLWSNRRRLVGAAVVCLVLVAGLSVLWQLGQVAEAAVLDPHPGLVGWWRFDEGTGSVARDSSGNGNNGTVYGATWVDGKYGKALSFDGASNYVDCDSALADSTLLTLNVWIYPTNTHYQDVVSRGPGGISGGWEIVTSGGSLSFGLSFSDMWRGIGASVVTYGVWQMVTAVWDGTYMYLYSNGVLVAKSSNLGAYSHQLSTAHVYVGAWTGTANFFGGTIDEASIYNRALLTTEIGTLFQKGPDFSSKLLAKVPKGTTQVITTLSWQGMGNINVTIQSPSKNYTEDIVPVYQKTVYSTSDGTSSMLNIKRLSVSITALSSDENWYIVLKFDQVEDYRITVEVQK